MKIKYELTSHSLGPVKEPSDETHKWTFLSMCPQKEFQRDNVNILWIGEEKISIEDRDGPLTPG